MKASDVGTDVLWFKGDSTHPLTSDGSDYIIETTLATSFEPDGETKLSNSVLKILSFDSADAASYYCQVDYSDPILDDNSAKQALGFLGN